MGIQVRAAAALLFTAMFVAGCDRASGPIDYSGPTADWPYYGAGPGGGHFSAATQITPDNVRNLEVAWSYRSGDYHDGGNTVDGLVSGEPVQTSL